MAGSFTLEKTVCLASLSQALAPVTPFERMRFIREKDGAVHKVMEAAPLRKKNPGREEKRAAAGGASIYRRSGIPSDRCKGRKGIYGCLCGTV